MGIGFIDRQSTKPGRYKVTKSDGSSEYITLERADEPSVEGTPLNAATLNRLAERKSVSLTPLGNISIGETHTLSESIYNKGVAFCTVAYHTALIRIGGSTGGYHATAYNITESTGGIAINFLKFSVANDQVTLTLTESVRITITAAGVRHESGVKYYFGEVQLIV